LITQTQARTRREIAETLWREGRATYGFVERQFLLMKRYWLWELVWVIYSLTSSIAIGYGARFMATAASAGSQAAPNPAAVQNMIIFMLIGSLLWGYLSGLFFDISNVVGWERWEGTIEYTFMAPISRTTHILGMCLFSILYGVLRTVVMLGAVAVVFQLDLSHANVIGALLVLAVGSFSFMGLGTLVAIFPLMSAEKGSQITGIVEGSLLLFSGIYYTIDVLPGWMQFLSRLSPATYVLHGMRAALLDGASLAALWKDIWPLMITGVVLIPLGLKVFSWGEMFCKRTGRLKRSG
jgi:ABC-2 type transport system permease protein